MQPGTGLKLILGSASPRRRELLAQIGVVPDDTRPPDINEDPHQGEAPRTYVRRIARDKIAALDPAADEVILCADTTVAVGRRILGKAADRTEAHQFLSLLSGRRHRVITAVTVRRGERIWEKDVMSSVRLKSLTDSEIEAYLDTDDWRGKAGAYGLQGPAARFVPWIEGSYSAIIGLPLAQTANLLTCAGYRL